MNADCQLLQITLGPYRYAASADQIIALRRVAPAATNLTYGSVLVPLLQLAPLFGLPDSTDTRHALLVGVVGRWLGLAVNAVESLDLDVSQMRPLPEIVLHRCNVSWVQGVLQIDDQPLLVLNLAAIVQDCRERIGICNA